MLFSGRAYRAPTPSLPLPLLPHQKPTGPFVLPLPFPFPPTGPVFPGRCGRFFLHTFYFFCWGVSCLNILILLFGLLLGGALLVQCCCLPSFYGFFAGLSDTGVCAGSGAPPMFIPPGDVAVAGPGGGCGGGADCPAGAGAVAAGTPLIGCARWGPGSYTNLTLPTHLRV